ncbi:signal transduction histidine kinase [Neokomagataea thailandica NBRC 106555]|uniref:PAS domain-containing protein n=2 Tax=Neokomagataea TaxID=1223423 RepID=A0A4Y6V9F9_9PROT|nr:MULTISPECIES: PAS domain-containing protein [Neokomagataea]QDH25300.1 PAS domain-containing protein [Neokomagataea tanensis]GBR52462.1 signal transduction histidine kinase [Neokomagataea thailandica NBRC 106555]
MSLPPQLLKYCESATVAISLASTEYGEPLLYVNPSFEQLTGYNGTELYGKNCRLLQKNSPNTENRKKIRDFINNDDIESIRTPLINFKKDNTPFVNLLFMSKLKNSIGKTEFLFASQFNVSHTYPNMISNYENNLENTLTNIPSIIRNNNLILSGSLSVVANAAATIAQAKIMLDQIDASYI